MLRSLFSQLFSRRKSPRAHVPPPIAASQSATAEARRLLATRAFDEADAVIGSILADDADNADALVIRAEILRRRGRIEPAMQAYRRALMVQPRHAEAWLDLGVCHYLSGDYLWARVYFRFASKLEPDNADIWNELGLVEITLANFEKAEESLENAVARNPDHPEAWNNLGLVLARRGDLGAARRHFLRATFLRPGYYMAFCNLGLVCRDLELLEEAERALRRAADLRPDAHTAWLNLGMVLQDEGRLNEALEALERAAAVAPEDVDVLAAMSALWLRRGDSDRALAAAERGLKLEPQHADARLALAHAQLSLRRFEEGWQNYEARLRSNVSPLGPLPAPLCESQDVANRTVLVEREQGLGDEIMFASCLAEFASSGARCVLHCDRRLAALFQRSFPQVEVLAGSRDLEESGESGRRAIDCCVLIGSLPGRYRRSEGDFARAHAYLRADPEAVSRWRDRVAVLGNGLKVGLAWRGGLHKTGRALRSLPLERLLPVLRTEGVQWVNLQHRDHAEEIDDLRRRHGIEIARWDEALADLDETAALMESLDLVITVCSTVVHLAGALGRPVWTLTPHAPAWRYFMQGETMPWYPDVRLFRQRDDGDWNGVIDEVAMALRGRLTRAA